MKLLLIEDDLDAAELLVSRFRADGDDITHAEDGAAGLQLARQGGFDVLIVDRMMPKLDGLELVRQLRQDDRDTPVLFLTALGSVSDRVGGLQAGGDDYLVKPFAFSELLARIEVLARRQYQQKFPEKLLVGDLEVDLLARKVRRGGQLIALQTREFSLLEYLVKHKNQVVTRTMILENVWDYHFDPQTNVIDVHISRLRGKIDRGFDVPIIQTVRGAGYIVEAND